MDNRNVAFPPLTKRELFAAMAMQAAITGHHAADPDPCVWGREAVAKFSIEHADALIAELEKGKPDA